MVVILMAAVEVEWAVEPLTASDPKSAGPYDLLGRLGSGGMGRVYLGRTKTRDLAAVKVIREDFGNDQHLRERFKVEVENLRRVYGSRVARFEGAGVNDDGQPWLAVEYVPGRSLKEHVKTDGVLSTELVVTLGLLLAEGLGKIHQEGLLHRDLKPQNILLSPDGPKVIDFGLAVLADRDHQLTTPGNQPGTPAYQSPEQTDGVAELTPATDVYSLAATLVYAATGRLLYGHLRGTRLSDAIRDPQTLPDLSGLPSELVSLFGQMLAHAPEERLTLSVVENRLLELVEKSTRGVKGLRDYLVSATVTEESLPVDVVEGVDAAVVDDEPEPEPEVVVEPTPPPESSEREPRESVAMDVSWLVAKIREQYDRKPVL